MEDPPAPQNLRASINPSCGSLLRYRTLLVRPARTYSNGRKSPNRPDSGKVTVKGKGVHREVESEGSRRQTVGPMNKNLVEGWKAGVMLLEKQKPDNYPNCRQ